jgi:hypothetical protein
VIQSQPNARPVRILLDHSTPAPLRYWLLGHQVDTGYERGWAELTNGDLLRIAEDAGFDAVITAEKGIRYQQNLAGRGLALVVISTNDWTRIRNWKSVVLEAISAMRPGSLIEIEIPFH